ncbi:MAG: hypothetical protein CK429_32420 [Mycobacterium sp.]|jgi:hypothetical protein|nr:MAG: hypothetical protein CK429_32420 [Mycobacterium sp.]
MTLTEQIYGKVIGGFAIALVGGGGRSLPSPESRHAYAVAAGTNFQWPAGPAAHFTIDTQSPNPP